MANDKDFVVAGAVEVGKDTKVTLGTVTSNNIDLATGNYFADTPSGTSTYTISNAGDVQSFQLEVTGGTEEVAQNFSTTLYTGAGGTGVVVNNGIDLAGDGGLVWIKARASAEDHVLFDTERGVTKLLESNTALAEQTNSGTLTNFYSDGFRVDGNGTVGSDTDPYVSWTFKKEPSFFDVVTWTGDGTDNRQISHNLGSTVGFIITKKTSSTGDWWCYHRETGDTSGLRLSDTGAVNTTLTSYPWDVTDTTFKVHDNYINTNDSGATYVAYLFAHDDAADGLIQCGSYTGGGGTDVQVNLGWQPQWLLIRRSDSAEDWFILDTQRGLAEDGDPNALLLANTSGAESSSSTRVAVNSTGFFTTANTGAFNASGGTYIYIAIRAASDLDLTWPSSIEWAGGIAPSAPATGETDVFTLSTDDGGTSYVGVKTADNLS